MMDKESLNSAVSQGLQMPFAASISGETHVADSAAAYREQIAQMAMVIFETMNTLGEIKIEKIEIKGDEKSIIVKLDEEGMLGTIVEPAEDIVRPEIWKLLQGMRTRPAVTPAERRTALVDPSVLETIKDILAEYVGDFTDRIFQNQLKNQNIRIEELHSEDVRRVILALSKATSMIVGRTKGRELSKRLIELVK
ncbi:MAG: hypothetical protein JSV53_10420 [candidate division WOR-3 bacterium]|nr:MAG: hypothetical protein JSV53_10420 [candidate division WOR-3 bacterium]